MEAIFGLLVKNLSVDSRESAFLRKPTAHIKRAYRVKFVTIYFAENIVSQNKNFFFETLIKLFSDIWFYLFLQMFDLCADVRCSYKPCSWSPRPVKAIGLLWRPQWF